MITAIDTNILLDIFLPDPVFGEKSLSAVESAFEKGALVICNVVYAELVPRKIGTAPIFRIYYTSKMGAVPIF